MNQISILYKNKTKLIEKLEEQENITSIENGSFIKSMFKKQYADVYFHSGQIDDKALQNASNAKKTIVSSKDLKQQFEKEHKLSNINLVYPAIDISYENAKEIKKKVYKELEINKKKRIILFTAKNIKSSGVKEFIETIFSLNQDNFIGVIAADSKQINNLKFQLSKFDYSKKLLLLEDYKNINELFLAADIFLLPTHNKSFATSILKAMYCKCAVFAPISNDASELIDVFSTMESPSDKSVPFKIDALLMEKNELKNIKKQNKKLVNAYTLEKKLAKVNEIIQAV